jgi:hypothetical protein
MATKLRLLNTKLPFFKVLENLVAKSNRTQLSLFYSLLPIFSSYLVKIDYRYMTGNSLDKLSDNYLFNLNNVFYIEVIGRLITRIRLLLKHS